MITQPTGSVNFLVSAGKGSLPIGDIVHDPTGWLFWPSVYRRPITLTTAGEILHKLEELNQ